MGVYIKGMEMPSRCGRCDMCIKEADGDIDYHYACCITAARIDNLGEKMDDCPLVHVPQHGRLVDMGEIEERIDSCCDDIDCSKTMCNECAVQIVMDKVFDAPTIIPAEEGET